MLFSLKRAVLHSCILKNLVSYEFSNLEIYLENKPFDCSTANNDDGRNFSRDQQEKEILVKTKKMDWKRKEVTWRILGCILLPKLGVCKSFKRLIRKWESLLTEINLLSLINKTKCKNQLNDLLNWWCTFHTSSIIWK